MGFVVGTDVGGSFTDLWVASEDGAARTYKVPTSKDVLSGIVEGLKLAAAGAGLDFPAFCARITRFGHGTTVGLNALLTGTTARTGVLTTEGFADTLEIGRLKRQTSGLNELELIDHTRRNRTPPIVPRDLIAEVPERIDRTGRVVRPLDEDAARAAIRRLKDAGAEAIAVCTLFSTANPAHEVRLGEMLAEEMPGAFVSLSHMVSPAVGEYARMSTTAANAALGPIAGRYLKRLEEVLGEAGMRVPILMMTCTGDVLPTEVLTTRPVFGVFSGPAGGVRGSQIIGTEEGQPNLLTTDIGGTSFDVGLVAGGAPAMRDEISVGGHDLRVHSVDVSSIGAGGGSIASVAHGQLSVGPRSAGSTPGPVCYGRGGTEPTATDADLVLGVLDAENFLGGAMRLDLAAARAAIEEKVAKPLGVPLIEAAWGIRKILDSRMADLLRRMTIERGHDPKGFALYAIGGAGPSHAWALARDLGLDAFTVPAAATVQSAFGAAASALGLTAERQAHLRVKPGAEPSADALADLDARLQEAVAEADDRLRASGAEPDGARKVHVAMRYRGQTHSLDVPLDAPRLDAAAWTDLRASFVALYDSLFGAGAAEDAAGFELLSLRVTVASTVTLPPRRTTGEGFAEAGTRQVWFDDPAAPSETSIYRAVTAPEDLSVDGPAIIEFPGQNVVIPPGWRATSGPQGTLSVRQIQ